MSTIVLRDNWAKYSSTDFWTINNIWNKGSLRNGIDYTQTITVDTDTFPSGTTLSWSWPSTWNPLIYAYPEVIVGYKPWDNYGSLDFTSQIDDLKEFKINYNLTIGGQTDNFNVAFELWLTDRAQGQREDINTELMIWVHDGALNPAGSPVGQYDGERYDATVYARPDHGDASGGSAVTWQYIALEASTDVLAGQIDIRHILLDLKQKGLLTGSEFVSGYELGAEVAAGSGSLKINSLSQTFSRVVATDGPGTRPGTDEPDTVGSATDGPDNLVGTAYDDHISGLGGNDVLTGSGGNDWLDGGTGSDKMRGGPGNDTYIVNVGDDVVNEALSGSTGTDTVQSMISFSLANTAWVLGAVENLTLLGSGNINGTGNALNNVISGNAGINALRGAAGDDILNGAGGNDIIYGGAGNDRLTGGAGNDSFVFDTLPSATTNVDTVIDFDVMQDTIRLDNAVMPNLGGQLGTLAAAAFGKSTTGLANDGDERIIYEIDTGWLTYDINGSAAGGSVHFAKLAPNLALSAADFIVI